MFHYFLGIGYVPHWCNNCLPKDPTWIPSWWIPSLWLCHQLCWHNLEVVLVHNQDNTNQRLWLHLQHFWLLRRQLSLGQGQWLHILWWNVWLCDDLIQVLCSLLLCWLQGCHDLWIYPIKFWFLNVTFLTFLNWEIKYKHWTSLTFCHLSLVVNFLLWFDLTQIPTNLVSFSDLRAFAMFELSILGWKPFYLMIIKARVALL